MGGAEVGLAVATMVEVLVPHTADRDWQAPAGSLQWSCWTTAAHVAHDPLAYAGQVISGAAHGYLPSTRSCNRVPRRTTFLDVIVACGRLLSCALDAAGPDARGWHWGPTDPSGFAALGVNEVVVHTVDICRGWGQVGATGLAVLRGSAEAVPDVPPGDPVQALLWVTGRDDLNKRTRSSPATCSTWTP